MSDIREFYIEWTETEILNGKHNLNGPIELRVSKFKCTHKEAIKIWNDLEVGIFFRIHFGYADCDMANTTFPYLGVKASKRGII